MAGTGNRTRLLYIILLAVAAVVIGIRVVIGAEGAASIGIVVVFLALLSLAVLDVVRDRRGRAENNQP